MSMASKAAYAAVISIVLGSPAFPASLSFTGGFGHDNDVQLFGFNLLIGATVTFQTLGYGGSGVGLNAAGQNILPGGFEPVLGIFHADTGALEGAAIQPGPPGDLSTCPPRAQDPNRLGLCQDAYAQVFLSAGNYLLSLTQSGNDPIGPNLSDGFFWVDVLPIPDFNNGFLAPDGLQGTSAWALDISFVDAAGEVPEPASALLVAAGLILAGIGARRRRSRAS